MATKADGRREPGQWCVCGHAKAVHLPHRLDLLEGPARTCAGGNWPGGDEAGVFVPCACSTFKVAE